MMNRVVLVGRLTRDPELRRTLTTDVAVCSFTLAIDDRIKDTEGNKVTTFINVTVWNNQAENAAKFLRKGSLAGVDGRLRQRSYLRKDGTKASIIEVVADSVTFLEPKSDKELSNEPEYIDEQPLIDESKNLDSTEVIDEDIPF